MRTTKPFLAAALALAVLGGLSGCSQPTPTKQAVSPATLCMAPPAKAHRDKPVIAVLAGTNADDQSPQIAAQRAEALGRVTTAGFETHARLLVEGIGDAKGTGDLAVNTQLTAEGANTSSRKNAADCKSTGVTSAIDRLQKNPPDVPVNVLDALRRLDGHLTGLTSQRVSVVLMSNMLNATPNLPLDKPDTLQRDPASLINDVERAGLLPDCRSWDVYVIGAGATKGGGIDDAQKARLQTFWTAFFDRCGGRIVAYDSALTQFPVTPTKAPAGARPAAFHPQPSTPPTTPAPTPATATATAVTLTLSDTVLFADDSAELTASADAALTQALARITRRHVVGDIEVHGFTDTNPTRHPGGNAGLSQRRAQAVVDWLATHGIASERVQAFGHGPANPVADNTTAAGRAKNRRVEITFTTTGASP